MYLRTCLMEMTDVIFHHRTGRALAARLRHVEVEERGHAFFAAVRAFDVVMTTGGTDHCRFPIVDCRFWIACIALADSNPKLKRARLGPNFNRQMGNQKSAMCL